MVTDLFRVWYEDLSLGEQESVSRVVSLLEDHGTMLGWPYSSAIAISKYAMRELRIQHQGRPYRVLYAFDPRRQAVLLLGGDKTGRDRFYDEMVPIADAALKEYLSLKWARTRRRRRREDMAVTRWKDLKHKMSPARREQLRREAEAELLEMDLKAMRETLGKTQVDVATVLDVSQGQVSETENREDHRLSTLRRYVEALGGELEVIANFGDRRIRLRSV